MLIVFIYVSICIGLDWIEWSLTPHPIASFVYQTSIRYCFLRCDIIQYFSGIFYTCMAVIFCYICFVIIVLVSNVCIILYEPLNIILLQCVSIVCHAERCISYDRFCLTDRLSDRLSVTVQYHAKTTPATIMRSSLEDSPMTSFLTVNFAAKFQGKHGERGLTCHPTQE